MKPKFNFGDLVRSIQWKREFFIYQISVLSDKDMFFYKPEDGHLLYSESDLILVKAHA